MTRSRFCAVFVLGVVLLACVSGRQSRHKRTIMYPNYNEPENYYQNQSLSAVETRRLEQYDEGRFQRVRPGQRRPNHPSSSEQIEIPLDFLKRLNELENISDFIPFILGGSENISDPVDIGNRFGADNLDERKSVVNAKSAKCMPEERTISLMEQTNDASVVLIPSCTRVMRCGGCCSTSILSCQPVETEIINFRVYVTQYTGNMQLKVTEKRIIPVEQHTKCKCDCITKAKDCNQYQEYRPGECSCACTNTDEREKCYAANHRKVWDTNNCSCACRQIELCSTGQLFNPATCRCANLPDRMTRRHTSELQKRRGEKRRQNVGQQPVVPVASIESNEGN